MDRDMINEIAAMAHGLWCAAMIRDSWSRGPSYDPRTRTHDALVPFAQLGRHDQRRARIGIEAQELGPLLISAIRYQRGPDREFTVDEMRPGLDVGLVDHAAPGGRAPFTGIVESWSLDAEGELDQILVRWQDGQRHEYLACERALVRVEHRSTPTPRGGSEVGQGGGRPRPRPGST